MEKRVKFRDKFVRDKFFLEVLHASKFQNWKNLREAVQIPKSMFEKYRSGAYLIPLERYHALASFLSKPTCFDKHIELIDANWGVRKGGKVTSHKHPEIFAKGREISWQNRTQNTQIRMEMLNDKEFTEFIGAFMGDAFTNTYDNHYLTQFTGDARYDLTYYQEKVIPFLKQRLHLNSTLILQDNTLRLNVYSKLLHLFLTKDLKFPAGKKCYTVKIPEIIFNSETTTSILRGIYDTDGCFFVDKRDSYSQPYPRITIQLANKTLIQQIYDILELQGLNPRITKKGTMIQINGEEYCKKFLNIIGFSNERHLKRIQRWSPHLLR